MFPDPSLKWKPYPSVIDGIERPPFVFDQGLWRGVLHLIVLSPKPHLRFYGVELSCEVYFGTEEMIYSVADHGDAAGAYDGGVYIKEAASSALLRAFAAADPVERKARHFSFVGGDYCYEALGCSEPIIHTFADEEEAHAWGPPTRDRMSAFHPKRTLAQRARIWSMSARRLASWATAIPSAAFTPEGTHAFSKPSFAASLSRSGAWATGLISPESAISPRITQSLGTGRSDIAETSAAATARSAAGSDRR